MTSRDAAHAYLQAGLCVLPAIPDQKRPALPSWKNYQTRLPTEAELQRWFGPAQALCLVTGSASGNLEMIDFDLGGEAFQAWYEQVEEADRALLARLVIEQSPSGGWHVAYRCQSPVCGNQKLAQRKQPVDGPDEVAIGGKRLRPRKDADGQWHLLLTLIETRGDGGLFLCSPSPGYELLQGEFTQLPVLTDAERDLLLRAAWSLNEQPDEPASPTTTSPPASGRPGDDFNERGDVRAVLKRHGWTLVRGGDNEYWRRPGKTNGSSATLKDGVFYVFSSSAPPFEPNQGYSPFAVYAHLEHDGDFEAAASALRHDGYGGDPPESPDVDLSGIIKPADAPEPPEDRSDRPDDPGEIPHELLRVPGFVGEIMDFCMRSARYPCLPLAFCGAMALQSFLCSRKVRDQGGLRPNLYMLALAGTGTGKNQPRKINSYILGKIGLGGAVGDQISSGQGLEDEMLTHRKMLYQTDEVDHLLKALSTSKETYHSMLLSMLLQFYTEADQIHAMRTKAKGRNPTAEIRGEIDQPGLVIFGTATPECFYESLSTRLLTNGLFSRSIAVDVGKRGHKQDTIDLSELPEHLIDAARWWKDYNPAPINPLTGRKPDLDEVHPTPAVVPYTDGGYAVLDRFATRADDEYDTATAGGDRVRAVLWTRACENAMRLALVYACSRDRESPRIDAEVAEWATRLIDFLMQRMLYMASQHVAENPFHAECLKVIRKLGEAPGQQMLHSVLLKRMKLDVKTFKALIDTLVEGGDIARGTVTTPGRSGAAYRLL